MLFFLEGMRALYLNYFTSIFMNF